MSNSGQFRTTPQPPAETVPTRPGLRDAGTVRLFECGAKAVGREPAASYDSVRVVQPAVALTIGSGSVYDTPLVKHFCAKFICPAEKISTQKQPNSVAK